ncbi:MAG TPA: hypothetical protein VM261_25880 [Kofleriaceae bacterium]|nr:hypothetical protein [Kofleriaceae bacterium]
MKRAAIVFTALAACTAAPVASPTTPPASTPARSEPATHVVALEPLVATPVMKGPFIILTINPGSDLQLGISKLGSCDDNVAWFIYSGGGAAVAAGDTLCAVSRAEEPVTHGFSGHD